MKRVLTITAALCLCGTGLGLALQDDQDQSRADMMRTKLLFSQSIVQGLATEDFDLLASSSKEIIEMTKAEAWLVPEAPEYSNYSDQFRKSLEALKANAEDNNLDGAAMRFYDVTTKCMDCHSYLRRNDF